MEMEMEMGQAHPADIYGAAKDESSSSRKKSSSDQQKIVRRIENLSSRQVTFSKRRTGLLKKAYELSVLCDAQVGVLVFSSTGRLSEFANPSMPDILQKYQETLGKKQENGQLFQNLEYWKHEAVLLKKQLDFLQMQESYLLGENLTCYQLKDLEILESQLCSAIERIRERKMECLQLQAQEMCKKESFLLEENSMLRLKIADVESKHESAELRTSPSSQNSCCGGAACTKCKHQCALRTFGVSLQLGLKP